MRMNTFCHRRGQTVDHLMIEKGPRIPIHKDVEIEVATDVVPAVMSMPYVVAFQCKICGDSGIFDQDGKAKEYHQATTVFTGKE